jgi:hypothetical protein
MNDQNGRHARLRNTATAALAALAALGAIAGATALGAKPDKRSHAHATAANKSTTKTPTSPAPGKSHAPQPGATQQPFFNAVEQLVNNGTISATQGQAVDSQIRQGYIDPSTLTGFTQAQLQAVEQALGNAKRALAPTVGTNRGSK